MADAVPIPAALWQRIQAFLKSGASGQIVLDIHAGKVQGASLNERIRDPKSALDQPTL